MGTPSLVPQKKVTRVAVEGSEAWIWMLVVRVDTNVTMDAVIAEVNI